MKWHPQGGGKRIHILLRTCLPATLEAQGSDRSLCPPIPSGLWREWRECMSHREGRREVVNCGKTDFTIWLWYIETQISFIRIWGKRHLGFTVMMFWLHFFNIVQLSHIIFKILVESGSKNGVRIGFLGSFFCCSIDFQKVKLQTCWLKYQSMFILCLILLLLVLLQRKTAHACFWLFWCFWRQQTSPEKKKNLFFF